VSHTPSGGERADLTLLSTSSLPPLYARWMEAWLPGPMPSETKATCSNCAMCAPSDGQATPHESYFSPVTKCCTYMPELANYLVGGIVSDEDPDAAEGRRSIEERIDRRLEVTPLGLGRSRLYAMLYECSHDVFGRAQSMECPHHLADGRCGVWRHRESTCATWFCKHERGQVSKQFWRRMHDLLAGAEFCLSRHCMLALGLPAHNLETIFPASGTTTAAQLGTEQLDSKVDMRAYEAAWGTWAGREREFYRKCAALTYGMQWEDVLRVGGAQLLLLQRLTEEAHARTVSSAIPERVKQGQMQVLYSSDESARVCAYSNNDPMKVPRKVLHVLHHFDGQLTDAALAEIEAKEGVRLSQGVVRKLVDFGILVEA